MQLGRNANSFPFLLMLYSVGTTAACIYFLSFQPQCPLQVTPVHDTGLQKQLAELNKRVDKITCPSCPAAAVCPACPSAATPSCPRCECNADSIETCNKLFFSIRDNQAVWAMDPNREVHLKNGKRLQVDDVLFGMDVLFETDRLYLEGSYMGIRFGQDGFDAIAINMVLWRTKPDLIIELGTASGASALMFASLMREYTAMHDPAPARYCGGDGNNLTQRFRVVTFDVDCGPSRAAIEAKLPLWESGVLFYCVGSDTQQAVEYVKTEIARLHKVLGRAPKVFVNHDARHTSAAFDVEMPLWAPFVTPGQYLLMQDTKLDRLWSGSTLHASIARFLATNPQFTIDRSPELFHYTQHPKGWLLRT